MVQAGLELITICLPLPLSPGIKGAHHHIQLATGLLEDPGAGLSTRKLVFNNICSFLSADRCLQTCSLSLNFL